MFCPSLWLKRSFVLSDALCGCSAVGRERAVGTLSRLSRQPVVFTLPARVFETSLGFMVSHGVTEKLIGWSLDLIRLFADGFPLAWKPGRSSHVLVLYCDLQLRRLRTTPAGTQGRRCVRYVWLGKGRNRSAVMLSMIISRQSSFWFRHKKLKDGRSLKVDPVRGNTRSHDHVEDWHTWPRFCYDPLDHPFNNVSSGVGFPIVFKTVTEGENILQLTSLEQISFELNEAETPKRTLHDFTRRLKKLADRIIRTSKYEHYRHMPEVAIIWNPHDSCWAPDSTWSNCTRIPDSYYDIDSYRFVGDFHGRVRLPWMDMMRDLRDSSTCENVKEWICFRQSMWPGLFAFEDLCRPLKQILDWRLIVDWLDWYGNVESFGECLHCLHCLHSFLSAQDRLLKVHFPVPGELDESRNTMENPFDPFDPFGQTSGHQTQPGHGQCPNIEFFQCSCLQLEVYESSIIESPEFRNQI